MLGVIDTPSPNASLSLEITRTSPDDARVTTYRVDVDTHPRDGTTTGGDTTDPCPGEVAYRLDLTVDYRKAMCVAVYEDGEVTACGGTDCEPFIGDERRRWWANGTVKR